jgi:ATP-dependent DNA helicase RecG
MSRSNVRTSDNHDDLLNLRGVGVKFREQLNALGIEHVHDLLLHLPNRYEDRTRLTPIGSLTPGMRVLVNGRIEYANVVFARRRSLLVVLNDGTGLIHLRFFYFNQAQQQAYKSGGHLRCFGEVRAGYKGLEMVHPSCQRIRQAQLGMVEQQTLTPVYPSSNSIKQHRWLQLTDQALTLLRSDKLKLTELLPSDVRRRFQLPSLKHALQQLHRPAVDDDLPAILERRHPAQQRVILEELMAHHLAMKRLNLQLKKLSAPSLRQTELCQQLLAQLPFTATAAQQRVIAEICDDLAQPTPMLRLLQGDVGSGKTVVAAAAAAVALASGQQVALVAPTELLAEQHLRTMRGWFEPLGVDVVWLSGRVTGKKRTETLTKIATGQCLVIGTHALMQEGIHFHRLGLVIVDEQHRFGVGQRLALRDKGSASSLRPHQLIMTATPIPRTLAMTAYAGLAVSIIDELPPGRKPVTTVVISSERRAEVIQRLAEACSAGRQAYWVCTIIEESEHLVAQAAEQTTESLRKALPDLSIDLVHGRLKPADKERVMQRFRDGLIHLLVATTVIEVGVDVPNASLMIIDNAERLGLSQLHQLRGRVGRGSDAASCVLLYQTPLGGMAKARLETMRNSNDGFYIAEQDLNLRGPGEVLGTRQTGIQQMRIADLGKDHHLLDQAIELADAVATSSAKAEQALIQRWIGDAASYGEV